MKVFRVYVEDCGWDEYDSAVIVAESEESVRNSFVINKYGERDCILDGCDLWFNESQGEIHIEEIDMTKPAVICASFNAG